MASTVWTCTVRATAPRAVTTERGRGEGFGIDLAGAGEQDVEVAVGALRRSASLRRRRSP
jgi:hypothetical protein